MNKILPLLLFMSFCLASWAQNTVGLLSYDPSQTYEGYNLIYPHNQPSVLLLNNCGEIVHRWDDAPDSRPGNTAYLLEDGRIVKTKRNASIAGDAIWAGGGGATIEIRDWDNNLEWSYTINNDTARLHHDIALTNDGNILAIVWELKTQEDAIQAGRNPALLPEGELWPDYIVELEPVGTDQVNVVWEWHAWDHLVQDFDATKDNFGTINTSQEKININYVFQDGAADWMHSNALDYDPFNDHIMLSVPNFGEIWIIDHSTTTEEAAGSSGGFSGRGGDLLWRWGNDAAFQQGTEMDQKLFYQHDAQWVDDFLDFTNPYFGRVAVYNNRVGPDFSTVNILNPQYDMYTTSFPMVGNVFAPQDFDLTLTHPIPQENYSTGLSGIQVLPNGNFLINSGRFGYSFELNPNNELVWEYKTPLMGGNPVAQGTELEMNNNLTFRITRYPTEYDAFDGRDLSPQGFLELEPDTIFCDLILPIEQVYQEYGLEIFPNPASNMVTLEWDAGIWVDFRVYDIVGREMAAFNATGGRKFLDVSNWSNGVYILEIDGMQYRKFVVNNF